MENKLKIVILAGGYGTRLWPLSRKTSPKQFTKLKELGGKSLFQMALLRALEITPEKNIFIVTAKDIYFHSEVQSKELGINLDEKNYILQPSMKETLPIIALATKKIGSGNILIMPSDHIIENNTEFKNTVLSGLEFLDKSIVIFGIKTKKPERCYGYIEKEEKNKNISKVKSFHEKPDKQTAKKYVEKGFLWNSGIFLFNSNFFWKELEKANNKMKNLFFDDKLSDDYIFDKTEAISIDYGLMEKSKNVVSIDLNIYRNDLGSFDAIGDYLKKKKIINEKIINTGNCKNNIVLSEARNKEIALIDVKDLIVIDHEDVILISKKGSSQKVKEVIKKSKNTIGLTEYRPWGKFRILEQGIGYKTKNLTVLAGKKLSLQMHYHRSENWVVVSGTAKITIGEEKRILEKGEGTFVPIGTKHRLENPGKVPLIIIETQIGDYLEEDDIIRFNDDFGRK